ncbi:MAG: hypothetical protein QXS76_01615 [Candidatus Bathyarchaeia archaeon]
MGEEIVRENISRVYMEGSMEEGFPASMGVGGQATAQGNPTGLPPARLPTSTAPLPLASKTPLYLLVSPDRFLSFSIPGRYL